MTSFLKELQDITITRVKNTLFLTFIVAWMTVNYNFSLKLLFNDINIEDKISFIKTFEFTLWHSLVLPLLIVAFYQLVLQLLNLCLSEFKDKTVNKYVENHKNETLKQYYISQRKVEIEKVKLNNIAREEDIRLKKEELKKIVHPLQERALI